MPTSKPIQAPESFEDLVFPLHGLNVATEIERMPPQTTPIGVNVRTFEPTTMRGRGGARPGLVKYLPQLPNGHHVIQHLNFVVDPTTDALLSNTEDPFPGPDPGPGFVLDPSTNNLGPRNPGRYVPRRGSGVQPNRRTPKKTLTISADDVTQPIGTALDQMGYSVSGLQAGDTITSVLLTSDGENELSSRSDAPFDIIASDAVGTVVGGGSLTGKYKITYVDGLWQIPNIAFVQANSGSSDGVIGHPNLTVAFTAPVTKGNLLLIYTFPFSTPALPTDSLGNVYKPVLGANFFYYAIANATGANSWTSPNRLNQVTAVMEYTGTNAILPIDGDTTNSTPSLVSSWPNSSTPVNQTGETLVAVYTDGGSAIIPVRPFGVTVTAPFLTVLRTETVSSASGPTASVGIHVVEKGNVSAPVTFSVTASSPNAYASETVSIK